MSDFKDIHGCEVIKRGLELCAVSGMVPVFYGNIPLAERLHDAYRIMAGMPSHIVTKENGEATDKKPNVLLEDVTFFCQGLMAIHPKGWVFNYESTEEMKARVDAAIRFLPNVDQDIAKGSIEESLIVQAERKYTEYPGLRRWTVIKLARAAAALSGSTKIDVTHIAEAIQFSV